MNKAKRLKRAKLKQKENNYYRQNRKIYRKPKYIEKSLGNGEWVKTPNPFYVK